MVKDILHDTILKLNSMCSKYDRNECATFYVSIKSIHIYHIFTCNKQIRSYQSQRKKISFYLYPSVCPKHYPKLFFEIYGGMWTGQKTVEQITVANSNPNHPASRPQYEYMTPEVICYNFCVVLE